MASTTLVSNQIEDGQRLIDALVTKGFAVNAACWIRPSDEDRWWLYIASPEVGNQGLHEAYGRVLSTLREQGTEWLSDADIKLVNGDHRLTRDAADFQKRYPDQFTSLSVRQMLGGVSVEEVYIYSLDKVELTIYQSYYPELRDSPLSFSFDRRDTYGNGTYTIGGSTYVERIAVWTIKAPKGAVVVSGNNGIKELEWNFRGKRIRTCANDIFSLADLRLQGFSIVKEPAVAEAV